MILLAPGGAKNAMMTSNLRRWPIEHYVTLAKSLLERGERIGLIGGKDDLWAEDFFAGLDITSFIGKTNIPQLMTLIKGAKALVSHDSGVVHIAYYQGTPLVALYGPTSANNFLPPSLHRYSLSIPLDCAPCYDGRFYADCKANECMQQITPLSVLQTLSSL
jgi:heptosyltransferase-2